MAFSSILPPLLSACLTLALPLPAGAQGSAPVPLRDREHWLLERFGEDSDGTFGRRVLGEAARERLARPEAAPVAGDLWRSIGPDIATFTDANFQPQFLSGRVRTLLQDPTEDTTLYVLSAAGGLWKLTDAFSDGPTWTALTDDLGSLGGGSVAVGRTRTGMPTTLYLGMGDPFFPRPLAPNGSLSYSTNGGTTWNPSAVAATPGPAFTQVWDLKVDASAAQDIVLVGTDQGLLRSVDGGASYRFVAGGPGQVFGGCKVQSLVRTSGGWLAWAVNPATDPRVGAIGLLCRSTDQGATWAQVLGPSSLLAGAAGRATLGVGVPGDAVVYAFAATAGNGRQLDLFRSADGGGTWTALGVTDQAPTNAFDGQATMDLMQDQPSYNQMLLVDPTDAARDTVYLGGQGASAVTRDGGGTWRLLSDWVPRNGLPYVHADFHAAAYLRGTGDRLGPICVGTDGGIAQQLAGSGRWDSSRNKGLVTGLVNSVSGNPALPFGGLSGLQDCGTLVRYPVPRPNVWHETKVGGDGGGVGWSQANQAVALSSTQYNGISRSVSAPLDLLARWAPATAGIFEGRDPLRAQFGTPVVTPAASADPTGLVFFTYTRLRVYRTDDGALTWRATPFAIPASAAFPLPLRSGNQGLAVSPVDTAHLTAVGSDGTLWMTGDGAATAWSNLDLTTRLPGWPGTTASVAYANNAKLYVCSEYLGTAPGNRVARSLDGGGTWTFAGMGLPDLPVTRLVVDPADPTGDTVYAGTWLGVYRTRDGGAGWTRFGAGLPQVWVTDLYLAPDSSFLRASTWGRGVWEVASSVLSAAITAPDSLAPGQLALASVPFVDGATYRWTVTGGLPAPLASFWARMPFTAGPVGDLTLAVQVDGADGTRLTATRRITVAEPPAPDATFTLSGPAFRRSDLRATAVDQPGCIYRWTVTGGTIRSGASGTVLTIITPDPAPNLVVTLTVTHANGVAATTTQTVPFHDPLEVVIAGPAFLRPGAASSARIRDLAESGTTYAWTILGGTLTSSANAPGVTFTAGPEGAVELALTATLAGFAQGLPGASVAAARRIIVSAAPPPAPSIQFTVPVATFNSLSGAGVAAVDGASYLWRARYGCRIEGPDSGPTVLYQTTTSQELGLYVRVTDALGQSGYALAAQPCVPPSPTLVAVPVPAQAEPRITVPVPPRPGATGLTASVPSLPGFVYRWTVTNGVITSYIFNITTGGVFPVVRFHAFGPYPLPALRRDGGGRGPAGHQLDACLK